jgi:hypothetical protein
MPSAKDYLNRLLGTTDSTPTTNAIPEVPNTADSGMYAFLRAVKDWIGQSTGSNRLLTWRDLMGAGLATTDETGTVIGAVPGVNYTPPPAPTNLTAVGAMTNILVEWEGVAYGWHAFTEIYANGTDNLGSAVLVGTVHAGTIFAHSVGTAQSRYYWVRFVSQANIAGPWNASNGVLGETSQDPAWLLDVLTGELTESQLYADLSARIDLIDDAGTLTESVTDRIMSSQSLLQAQISDIAGTADYDNGTTYAIGDLVIYDAAIYRAIAATTGNLPTNATYWVKIGNYDSIAEAVIDQQAQIDEINLVDVTSTSAAALALVGLQASMTDANAAITDANAAITAEQSARVDGDGSVSRELKTITAQAQDAAYTDLTNILSIQSNTAAIQEERIARATEDSAIASSVLTLSATVAGNTAAIISEQTARADADTATSNAIAIVAATVAENTAAIVSEQTARTDADSSLASDISTVSARLNSGGDISSAIILSQTTAQTGVDNAAAAQSDVDTVASSVTTLQTTVGEHTTSIETNATSINGIQAKYTVKIDNNGYVTGYGLISTANNGTPTSEFAVVADKFTIAPVATAPDADATAPFFHLTTSAVIDGVTVPAGTYIKSAFIADATITSAKIGLLAVDDAKVANLSAAKLTAGSIAVGEYIQSSNYSAGSAGWRIHGDGNLEANSGTFRGALSAATGTFAGSLSAATGEFSGSLSAATGTFAGSLSAATGTFSGELSASTVTSGAVTINSGGAIKSSGKDSASDTTAGFFLGWDTSAYQFAIGNSTQNMKWNGSTLSLTGGSFNVSTIGNVRGGQTEYNTGTGFFLGYSDGAHKFSIGNPAGDNLTWNGSSLSLSGDVDFKATSGSLVEFTDSTTHSTTNSTFTKIREIHVSRSGTINCYFSYHQNSGGTGYFNIYKNGVSVGTQVTTTSSIKTYSSQNITVAQGDLIQVYARTSGSGVALCNDFSIRVSNPITHVMIL